jgi:anti-sigma factor RsiW
VTPDDEMLMAYADGELDALTAKRIERAIAGDPALADKVAAHRSLRAQLATAFPLVAGPDPLEAMIRAAPVPLAQRRAPAWRQPWLQAAAMAACLAIGVMLGTGWQHGPVTTDRAGALVASGDLAHALDHQLASEAGETRMLVTFRNAQGSYCRVFAGSATDGIACRADGRWRLIRTGAPTVSARTDYRQVATADPELMAAAQVLAKGEPLDAAQERQARQAGWKEAQ